MNRKNRQHGKVIEFDMSSVLRLSRWKKEKLDEREQFCDVEDSDDDESENEEEISYSKAANSEGGSSRKAKEEEI